MAPPFDASAPDVLALESGVGQSVGGSCDVALIRDLNHIESMAIKCEIPHTARLFFSAGTLMPGAPCQSVRPEDFGTGPCLHKSASAGQGSYWRISCRRRRSGVRLANDAGVVFILIEPGRRFAKGAAMGAFIADTAIAAIATASTTATGVAKATDRPAIT